MNVRIPTEWFDSLKRDDDLLIGELVVPFLEQMMSIEVSLVCAEGQRPTSVQRKTVDGFASRYDRIYVEVLQGIFRQYQSVVHRYREAFLEWGEDPDENAPLIKDSSELRDLVILQRLFIPKVDIVGTFGLGFWSKWEREHGVGVRYVDWSLDEVGESEVHFSFEDV